MLPSYFPKITFIAIFFTIVATLCACSKSATIPTIVPTAAIWTSTSTLAPTKSQTTNTVTPQPTQTYTATPTPQFTPVVSTREPTVLPPSGINITTPDEGETGFLGQQLHVSGLSHLTSSQTITVSLISMSGHRLEAVPAIIDELDNWRAILRIPHSVSGPAAIVAAVLDEEGQLLSSDEMIVELLMGDDPGDRFLTLSRPQFGEPLVSGYNILFDGVAQNPVNNLVTVSLWINSCQVQVSSQNFRLDGSGEWWGLLYVPNNIRGEACATAHFGSPGDQAWREAQTVVHILSPDDANAQLTMITLPRSGDIIPPGRSIEINGLAYNAPGRLVTVALILDNGRLLNEGVAAVDQFGFWELSLFIPASTQGPAYIIATSGVEGEDSYSETVTMIDISR